MNSVFIKSTDYRKRSTGRSSARTIPSDAPSKNKNQRLRNRLPLRRLQTVIENLVLCFQ